MTLEKIIYVTPGESRLGELTSTATSKLKNLVAMVLDAEVENNRFVFRMAKPQEGNTGHAALDTLLYISNQMRKSSVDTSPMNIYNLVIDNPGNVVEVAGTATNATTVIVGVTKDELKKVISYLKDSDIDTPGPSAIESHGDVFALAFNVGQKKAALSRFTKI